MLDDDIILEILEPLILEAESMDGDMKVDFVNKIRDFVYFGNPNS